LLVLVVTGLVLLLKKDKRSLHGDARFATGADLSKHGMFKKTGQSIVVGSHGRHGLALLLGSTANDILHGAPCDVLAVRLKKAD